MELSARESRRERRLSAVNGRPETCLPIGFNELCERSADSFASRRHSPLGRDIQDFEKSCLQKNK